ncbi:hypothetical protein ACHAXS_010913 [Conticribra weissflogii]
MKVCRIHLCIFEIVENRAGTRLFSADEWLPSAQRSSSVKASENKSGAENDCNEPKLPLLSFVLLFRMLLPVSPLKLSRVNLGFVNLPRRKEDSLLRFQVSSSDSDEEPPPSEYAIRDAMFWALSLALSLLVRRLHSSRFPPGSSLSYISKLPPWSEKSRAAPLSTNCLAAARINSL